MKKKFFLMAVTSLFCTSILFTSCNKDDVPITDTNTDPNSNLTMNISGLKDLGPNFRYQGWILVKYDKPISAGIFTVNASGVMSQTSFPMLKSDLAEAKRFIITIEPFPDTNTASSNTIIMTGDFLNNSAALTFRSGEYIKDGSYLGGFVGTAGVTYQSSAGDYKLATRTDGPNTNEKSGIWFASNLGTPIPNLSFSSGGLRLPQIMTYNGTIGWKYESWVEINGKLLSLGKFDGNIGTDVGGISGSDNFSGFSGSQWAPKVPGEDFLLNAPTGLTFPLDLSGAKVYITSEPNPDTSPDPFFVKILSATIPTNAVAETVYSMTNIFNTNAPTGTAVK
jgi:hypothetical protein